MSVILRVISRWIRLEGYCLRSRAGEMGNMCILLPAILLKLATEFVSAQKAWQLTKPSRRSDELFDEALTASFPT